MYFDISRSRISGLCDLSPTRQYRGDHVSCMQGLSGCDRDVYLRSFEDPVTIHICAPSRSPIFRDSIARPTYANDLLEYGFINPNLVSKMVYDDERSAMELTPLITDYNRQTPMRWNLNRLLSDTMDIGGRTKLLRELVMGNSPYDRHAHLIPSVGFRFGMIATGLLMQTIISMSTEDFARLTVIHKFGVAR